MAPLLSSPYERHPLGRSAGTGDYSCDDGTSIMDIVDKLRKACKERGAELIERSNGHFQIKGALLVNYYPNSKKRSAYVAGTTAKRVNVDHKDAVDMAFRVPKVNGIRDQRNRKGYRRIKYKLLAKNPTCHWCRCKLTIDTATLEHIIPLARGGLDNLNNMTLACEPCNKERGCDMPELHRDINREMIGDDADYELGNIGNK
jgi:5-methylcytosine-specific restriction endonuclease McrA